MPRTAPTAFNKLRAAQLDYVTENYCFRPFVKADVYPLFVACQNPDFNKFLLWAPPQTIEEAMVQVRKLMREDVLNQHVTFSAIEKMTGRWAGFARWIPFKDGMALSLWFHPDFWGKGVGSEVMDAMIHIAFKNTLIEHLYGMMQPDHKASVRLVEGRRMKYQESLDLMHDDGTPRKVHMYHLARTDWVEKESVHFF